MFEKLSFFLCMCYVALSRYLLVRFLVVASLFCYCLFTTISLIVINTKKTLHSFRWAFQSHFQDCAKEFPSRDRHREKEREKGAFFFGWIVSFFLIWRTLMYRLLFGLFWSANAPPLKRKRNRNESNRVPLSPTRGLMPSHTYSDKFLDWIK